MDPYRHRQLLHDRWINRASQRLGDIATLKYGSIREFFRVSLVYEASITRPLATLRFYGEADVVQGWCQGGVGWVAFFHIIKHIETLNRNTCSRTVSSLHGGEKPPVSPSQAVQLPSSQHRQNAPSETRIVSEKYIVASHAPRKDPCRSFRVVETEVEDKQSCESCICGGQHFASNGKPNLFSVEHFHHGCLARRSSLGRC